MTVMLRFGNELEKLGKPVVDSRFVGRIQTIPPDLFTVRTLRL